MNSVTGYSDMKMLYTVQQGMLPEEKSELNCADNGQIGSCIEDELYCRAKCKGQERRVFHTLEINRGEMGRALQGEKGKALLGGTVREAGPAYEKGPR